MNKLALDRWLTDHGARIAERAFSVSRSENWEGSSHEGGWFDLKGEWAWGRVTFWPNGRADMEVLSALNADTAAYFPDAELGDAQLEKWLAALEKANTR